VRKVLTAVDALVPQTKENSPKKDYDKEATASDLYLCDLGGEGV